MSNVAIQSLPSGANDARRLASLLGIAMLDIALHRFPDGELRVTAGPAASTTIIYAPLDQPNDKLIALLFAAETLRRDGAKRLVLVGAVSLLHAPGRGLPTRARLSARASSGGCSPGFSTASSPSTPISIAPPTSKRSFPASRSTTCRRCRRSRTRCARPGWIPPPSCRSGRRVAALGERSRGPPWARIIRSRERLRRGDRSVEITSPSPQLFTGRPVLLIDDIVSSGGTLIACAKALVAAGARSIDVIVTHALFRARDGDRVCRCRHPLHSLDITPFLIRPTRSRSMISLAAAFVANRWQRCGDRT